MTLEDAVAFLEAWRDDDQELRIPTTTWGQDLAQAIDVLIATSHSSRPIEGESA
jgi:hypothetical protein